VSVRAKLEMIGRRIEVASPARSFIVTWKRWRIVAKGGKVIVKHSQTARPAYQLYLLQWETAAGSAFGAFPELNSTVAGSFRAARLQARVVTEEQNFTSIDMERFSCTEEFVIRREQRVLLWN